MSERSLFRERDFRLVAGSIGVSALGDLLAGVALILLVQETTGSGIAVSALLICLWSPVVVLAGHVGLLVDRVETTRLLVFVSLAQTAVAAALAFVDSLAAVLVLAALLGVGFAISQACEFALVPVVSGAGRVQEGNGHVETARYVGFTVGPLCGGLLASVGGTSAAMLVNAGTFLAVAVAALSLRSRRPPTPHEAGAPHPRARDGILQLFGDRVLALGMGVAFVSLLFMSASIPADVFFVEDVLGRGDVAFSVVYTTWTIGMILGAVRLSRRVAAGSLALGAFVAVAVQGLGKTLPPLWLVFGFMLACYFAGGVAHGVKNVLFRTLIHERVPERLHGRAFAAFNGVRNGAELGALALGGLLVAAVGPRVTLLIAGGVSALAGLVGIALAGRSVRGAESAVLAPD
jgi:Na+/melibiose symporter-like transporter